jgi:hypothetical protein
MVYYEMVTKQPSYQLDALSSVGYIPLTLGRDEHEKLVRARELIRMGVTFEQRLDLLLENYASLERYTLDLALRNAIFSGDSPTRLNEGRHNINRHLNNLLSSAKLYIDQTAHALSEVYGRTSSQYHGFIESTNEEYEKTLAYRTMEALRGYVQHRGLPTHSISFSSRRDESSSDRTARNRHVVTFGLVPESIRQDGGFKPRVLHELESIVDKKGQIELMPLIREYASGIARIHKSTRMSISAELDVADKFMAGLFEQVYSVTGHSCISARIWENTAEGVKPCGLVSSEWTQERKFYINKNKYAEYLNGQYVSSL